VTTYPDSDDFWPVIPLKGSNKICAHGIQSYVCRYCKVLGIGGGGLCEHNRKRNQCKPCGGSSICSHGRMRAHCVDCGGTSICPHRRRRNRCKVCKGNSICLHGNIKYHCKKCSPCPHGKVKSNCRECDPRHRFSAYRCNAKKRSIDFSLSFEQFSEITKQPCTYCGDKKETNGIDRMDNDRGYSIENCVPCCSQCNTIKMDYSKEEFIARVTKIVNYQLSKRTGVLLRTEPPSVLTLEDVQGRVPHMTMFTIPALAQGGPGDDSNKIRIPEGHTRSKRI